MPKKHRFRKVPGLREGVEKYTASGFAKLLKIRVQSLYCWDRVPPDRCRDVERLTGIPRHILRPDIFDPPNKREAA